jgi:hypothetical protein
MFNLVKQDTISKQENRMLASKPEFDINLLDPYPVTYEKFYNDHFPFREPLSNFQTREIKLKLLNRPPDINGIFVGKDGTLFTMYERQYWQGTNEYTRDDVRGIAGILHKRALDYRARGIKFYIISPPMKSDIYPELNPPFYFRVADSVMEDLVAAALKKDTLIKFVCGKDILLHCKDKGLLFRVADSHWNERGAYYTYVSLMGLIHKDFPLVTPLKTSEFTFTDTVVSEGLAVHIGLGGFYKEHIPKIKLKNKRAHPGAKTGWEPPPEFKGNTGLETVKVVDDPALPEAIIVHDSYGATLIPFLAENFRKSVFLFDGWHYGPNWEIVDKEKPDIVILEIFSAHWTEFYSRK